MRDGFDCFIAYLFAYLIIAKQLSELVLVACQCHFITDTVTRCFIVAIAFYVNEDDWKCDVA